MDRMERGHLGALTSPLNYPPYRTRQDNFNELPSIGSVFGPDLCRSGSLPGGLNPPPYGYHSESPIRASGPPTLPQYSGGDDAWAHKQGQQRPSTPLASTMHYQKTNPEYTQPQRSSNSSDISSRPRHIGNLGNVITSRSRLDRVSMSPTTETTISYNDTYSTMESGTDMYSDQGESEVNSGIGDTQSQAGSTASGMYLRKFMCKTCKSTFKCDSLRRKHEMKHTKPFKCHFPDCKRKGQGFTSANDRDRHMNSVHKSHLSRPAIGYDCCYDHCRGNGKIFWRLDNFRNHLKKKHDQKGSKEQLEEFLKRAENECRRAHPPPGADTSMDTRSEPEYSIPCTSMENPGPAMSVDFHSRQPRRSRPPPVPRFPCYESASESGGIGQLPISPVSRGPHRDLESDSGDRMDIDEIPESMVATSHPRAAEPLSDTERTNVPQINGSLSHANSKVSSEGHEQGKENNARAQTRSEKEREREEYFRKIKELYKYVRKYNTLCDQLADRDDRYELILIGYSPSEASERTMPASFGHNNDECDIDESQLARIEENGPDCMDRDNFRHSGASHSLQTFITQDPTEESVMSRLLSSSGTAAPTAVASSSAIQVDTQCSPRQLVSPPISVASPQAATAEVSQAHQQQQEAVLIPGDELPNLDPTQSSPTRTPLRGSRSSPHGDTPKHGASLLLQNGKGTICPKCYKSFTMPSKLRKHMKRHSRPYACTFRGCHKVFGSKNDWKRHENSQHFQLELWKCGVIPPNSSGLCGKLSFRRESHTTHLRSVHGITDKSDITKETAVAHIGRNNFKTFWCGFCPAAQGQGRGLVVHLEREGLGGWDERFDHLARHFIDQGLDISTYKHNEEDDQHGSAQPSSDEDDGEMTVAEPTVVEKRLQTAGMDVLEEYNSVNARQNIVACTAPDAEKRGVELAEDEMGTANVKENLKAKNTPKSMMWLCCQQCSYPGPYIEAVVAACVSCEHQICKDCTRESQTTRNNANE